MDDNWNEARTAPMDGTPIVVRFIDDRGEYPGFAIRWDRATLCWRNHSTGSRIEGKVSRWRPWAETRRRSYASGSGR